MFYFKVKMFIGDLAQRIISVNYEENLSKSGFFYGIPIGMHKNKEAHEIFDNKITGTHIILVEGFSGITLLVYKEAFSNYDTVVRMKSWLDDCEQKTKSLFEDITKNMDFFKEKPSNDWEPRIIMACVPDHQVYYV